MPVSMKTVERYDRSAIKSAITASLDSMGGIHKVLGDRKRVLLKPNFVIPEMKPSNTHPDFYMAVAELFQEHGCEVTIGESPAFGSAEAGLRAHGVLDECRDKGIATLTFNKSESFDGIPDHKHYGTLSVAAELKDYDAIINLPKVKVHQQFVFTGATKNLYGCVVGKRKAYRHFVSNDNIEDFSNMIHLNAKRVAPLLNIADGITALHKHGPRGGDPFPLHRILVSDSYLEMDWVIARIIGLNPADTPLFTVLSPAQKGELVEACNATFEESGHLPDITNFQQSVQTPIEFSLKRMVNSVIKSIKQRDWRFQKV